MTLKRVSNNLPSVDHASKQIDPFVSMTVGSTVGSEYSTTVLETLETATASIMEIVGNKVVLQMTKSFGDVDLILGTSTIELTHQVSNIDPVDTSIPEALFENAIINWVNTLFDKTGEILDKDLVEWNGGVANTADATIIWDGTETLPATGDKYFVNITHVYSRMPEAKILWINSTVDRSGIEYGGLFYNYSGRHGQSFFKWIDPRNDFRKPDAAQTYFVSVQFSIGAEDINASIKGELFRTSFLSSDSDGVKEFFLDIPPANTATRTLMIARNTTNSFDEINTALQQLNIIRSDKDSRDNVLPTIYPLETFFNDPTISWVNRRKAELRNTSISTDFETGSFKWNNLAVQSVGATISWGTSVFGPDFGTTYYIVITPTDQPEEINTVTINWVNEFSDNTGIDYSSTLLFTTSISEAWNANGASDARLDWITTSAQVDNPVVVVNNSDIDQGNWAVGTASDYNEVGIRNQDPLMFFSNAIGGTNKIFRLFPSEQDFSNYSKVSFFIKTPRTWNVASPDLVLYVNDTTGGQQTVPFAVTEDNEYTYIIVDITGLTRAQVTEIGFQEGSGIISDLAFFVDGFEIRKLHPENGDFYFVNISYVDVSVPLSKINAFFSDGEKKIKTKLTGVNLDRDSVSEPLSTGQFTIDSVGRVVTGDAFNPLSKGDNLILEYHIQTGFEDKVIVNIPKFSRIGSHFHIQVPKKSTAALLEVFDSSESKYLDQEPGSDGTVQPFLLGPESNSLDEMYVGSEDRFRSLHFHLTQAADFSPSTPVMSISYSSLDSNGNLVWLTTGLTFTDATNDFTDISETKISINFATETDWDNWAKTQTQIPTNQDFTRNEIYWLKIEFDISTNGARPRVSGISVTKFEDIFDTDFRSISSFNPVSGLSTGSFHDEISVLAVRTKMLGLMTPKAEQLDFISNQADGFSFRNLVEAEGDVLDIWGEDLGAPRKGGETDLLYQDRLSSERKFLVSSLTGFLKHLSFVMDLSLSNMEIRQWWESSWILDINTRLSSSYKFAVQDIVRSSSLEDIITDGILFNTPFFLDEIGNLTKQFFWVSDSIDSTSPVDIIPNGFDLNDNADVSFRPTYVWQNGTKKIVWGETPPAFKIAPTETYHVGFFYIDPDSIPVSSLSINQGEDYFNFLNSFADDLTNILSNSLPIPGWNVKIPLLKNSDSSKELAQVDLMTTDISDLSISLAFKDLTNGSFSSGAAGWEFIGGGGLVGIDSIVFRTSPSSVESNSTSAGFVEQVVSVPVDWFGTTAVTFYSKRNAGGSASLGAEFYYFDGSSTIINLDGDIGDGSVWVLSTILKSQLSTGKQIERFRVELSLMNVDDIVFNVTQTQGNMSSSIIGDEIIFNFDDPIIGDRAEIAINNQSGFSGHSHLGNILTISTGSAKNALQMQAKVDNISVLTLDNSFKTLLSNTDFFVRTKYFDIYNLLYTFEGNYEDSSGNGFNVTTAPNMAFQTGKFGLGVKFNGTSSFFHTVSFAHPPSEDNGLSYSFWLNYTGGGSQKVFYTDGTSGGSKYIQFETQVVAGPNNMLSYTQFTRSVDFNNFFDGLAGVWTHVVFSVNHTTGVIKAYRNKTLFATKEPEVEYQVFPDANQVKGFGRNPTPASYADHGLDDFRIINHIVTQDEVNHLFSGAMLPGTTSGFFGYVIWLKFDSDFTDFSGNGRNATNNGVTFGSGQFGSSAVFNVGDYLDLGTYANEKSDSNTGISYSFWYKHPGISMGTTRTLYSDGLLTDTPAKRIVILSDDVSTITANLRYVQAGGIDLKIVGYFSGFIGSFVHCVITIETSTGTIRIYRNKTLVHTSSDVRYLIFPDAVQTKRIGKFDTQSADLDGELDDFRVASHVLSQAEIDAIFDNDQRKGGITHIVYKVPPDSSLLTGGSHTITIKALTSEKLTVLESGDKVNIPFSPDKSRLIATELFGRKILTEDQIFDRFTDLTTNDWSNPTNTDVELDTSIWLKDGSSMKIQTIDASSAGEIVVAPSTGALAFDASVYNGVSFWAMSTEETGVKIELEIVFEAGAPDLTFTYPIEFQETETWEFFKFPFNVPTTLKDEINTIGFRMRNGSALITFHIDDFQFVQEQNLKISVSEEDTSNLGLPDPDELKLTKTFKKEEFTEFPISSSVFWIRSSNDGTPMIPILFTEDKNYVVTIENIGSEVLELLHEDFTSSSDIARNLFVMNRNKKEIEGGKVNTNPETDNIYEDFKGILQKRKPASSFAEAEFVILD